MSLNEYLHHVRAEIKDAKHRIELAAEGRLSIRHRNPGSDHWVDVTQSQIDREKQTIAVFEAILARHAHEPSSLRPAHGSKD